MLSENPWVPSPKDKKWWRKRHQENLNTTATLGKDIKVVFIGSSSIDYWRSTGKEVWDAKYAPIGAINYGIRGDRTEHVLWRIANGELDGLSPKLVVIYIGGNNVPRNTEEDVVRGVNAVIDKLHEKLPNSNLLFISFFPNGHRPPVKVALTKIRNITDTLKPIIEGNAARRAHFLDLFWSYAPASLDRIYEELYQDDKLHQNLQGYKQWHDLMSSTFNSLMEN